MRLRRHRPGQLSLALDLPEPDYVLPPEPTGRYVVKEHHASRLHYDFRLEMDGVLKSWVVPKGPSRDPAVRRQAVQVEDHSLLGLMAQGMIRSGYGAGMVYRWDYGLFDCDGIDPLQAWHEGLLRFTLHGRRLRGGWQLRRTHRGGGSRQDWRLEKLPDEWAQPGDSAVVLGAQWAERGGKGGVQAVNLRLPL